MLRALIVDDEYEIREGLRQRIPWNECGIGQLFVAGDGDTALELALAERPDIIVTDIKMGRMSGLELISRLKEVADYDWRAVLISGYDDFDFVKQAVRLGAMDYILKPINTEELVGIVQKAADQVRMEKMDRLHRDQLSNQASFAVSKLREELLRELIEKPFDPYRETRVSHRLQTLKLEWLASVPLSLLIVEVDDLKAIASKPGAQGEKELVLFGIGNVVNHTLAEELRSPYAMATDSQGRLVAVFGCEDASATALLEPLARECLRRINAYVKVNASIGLSGGGHPRDGAHLHGLYLEAAALLNRKALLGGNRVFTDLVADEEGEGGRTEVSVREPGELLDLVRYGTDADIAEAMNRFEDMAKDWGGCSIRDVQERIFEWLLDLFRSASAAGWPDRSWERNPIALWDRLEQYDSMDSLRSEVERRLLEMAADFRRMKESSSSHIVCEAERIIRKRYGDNLSLQAVADEVHVTPIWLSKLFKKERGQTFLEKLTEARIAKSKELLGDVKYKIYQVSSEVGYKDPVHFAKLFKKQTGCTPKEYRRQRGISDE